MRLPRTPPTLLCVPTLCGALLSVASVAALAQTTTTVIQPENVRMDVAQVMQVRPVYQTLRATRMEPRCPDDKGEAKGLSRLVGVVKGALSRQEQEKLDSGDCELVPVEREFRRPIAYDVDYVYRGMKYRSRLPYDPGNRLRVRVSVMPHIPPLGER